MSFCFLFSVFCLCITLSFSYAMFCSSKRWLLDFDPQSFLIGCSLLKPYLHCFVFKTALTCPRKFLLCFFSFLFFCNVIFSLFQVFECFYVKSKHSILFALTCPRKFLLCFLSLYFYVVSFFLFFTSFRMFLCKLDTD